MGQLVVIRLKAKDDKSINAVNAILKKAGIKNSFTTEKDNVDWCTDINENPQSHQKHLKPITLEELKEFFTSICEVGAMSFDVAFSRTTDAEAKKYAKFIEKHADLIDSIRGGDELIERYTLTAAQQQVINNLNIVPSAPRKLPKDQRTKHDLQAGHLLCKSWGLGPFWVVFGKVDSPTFMKDRIYEDELYDSLYKDKQGRAYMLVPLLPLSNPDKEIQFAVEVYTAATQLGLRENINFFLPMVYGIDVTNYNDVAEDYKNWYTTEEIHQRFMETFEATNNLYPYNAPRGFVWSDIKKMFKPCGTDNPTSQIMSRCSVLTCLLRALGPQQAAETMTKLLGKTYIPVEF